MPGKHDETAAEVVVIGAGASGLFCAQAAARRGRTVLVLEAGTRACRKLRASGGGRCNLTHLGATAADYFSDNPHFCKSALARFGPEAAVRFFGERGLAFEDKEPGRLFCVQGAGAVARVLEEECERAGVGLRLDCPVSAVEGGGPFVLRTARGTLTAGKLVLAAGGPSWPDLGATDFAQTLARARGLAVVAPRPALVPLVLGGAEAALCRDLAGISLPARVGCGGRGFEGGLLFTHRGLSGPAVLDASCVWRPGMALCVDLLPHVAPGELFAQRSSRALVRTVAARHLPERLARALVPEPLGARPLNQAAARDLEALERGLRAWSLLPVGTEGLARAEVTAGGLDTRRVSSKTMEHLDLPGLFCVGECLDVTGRLGGYNLQWAWSSGFAAAQAL